MLRSTEYLGIWVSRAHVLALLPEPTTAQASAQGHATTRRLRDEREIPEGMTKAELARLLETESPEGVKAGQLRRALKASTSKIILLGAFGPSIPPCKPKHISEAQICFKHMLSIVHVANTYGGFAMDTKST